MVRREQASSFIDFSRAASNSSSGKSRAYDQQSRLIRKAAPSPTSINLHLSSSLDHDDRRKADFEEQPWRRGMLHRNPQVYLGSFQEIRCFWGYNVVFLTRHCARRCAPLSNVCTSNAAQARTPIILQLKPSDAKPTTCPPSPNAKMTI